jgi:hypothetical protein
MTLNILRTSRINTKLSAYTQVFGSFDYNKTPLAPLGTKVVIHERPQQRRTFGDHGREGWYIGPAMHHYRHYSIFVTATHGDRVSNTVEFFPTKVNMPETSSADRLTTAIEEISHIVKHQPHPAAPFLHNGEPTNAMLAQLGEIFAPTTPQTPPLLTTNRVVPRVQASVTEPVPSPRVAAATPRVLNPNNPAATPRVLNPSIPTPSPRVPTAPIPITRTPRAQPQPRTPKALTGHLREGSYWQPSQR